MNMPRFTAETSLYKTSGHYRTGRPTVDPSAQTVGPIWPAAKEQEGEIINVHGCPPGCYEVGEQPNITCVCIPPGDGEGGGEHLPPGSRPEEPYGDQPSTYDRVLEKLRAWNSRPCVIDDFQGLENQQDNAIKYCEKRARKAGKQYEGIIRCFGNLGATIVKKKCCIYPYNYKGPNPPVDCKDVPPQCIEKRCR
jgi:hypothetical protein